MVIASDCCCDEGSMCPDTTARVIFSESMSTDDVTFDLADVFSIILDGNYSESPTMSAPSISMTYPGGIQQLEIDVPANAEEFSNVIQYTFVPFFFTTTHTLDAMSDGACCGQGYSVCVEAALDSIDGAEPSVYIFAAHRPSGGANAGKIIVQTPVAVTSSTYTPRMSTVSTCSRAYLEGPTRIEVVDEGEETEVPTSAMADSCQGNPAHCTYSEDGANEVGFVVMLAAYAGYGANAVIKMRSASAYESGTYYIYWDERICSEIDGDPCRRSFTITMSGFQLSYTPDNNITGCSYCLTEAGAAEAINTYLDDLDSLLGVGYVFPYSTLIPNTAGGLLLSDDSDYFYETYRARFTAYVNVVYDEDTELYSLAISVKLVIYDSIILYGSCPGLGCLHCRICGSWTYNFSPVSRVDFCSGSTFTSDGYTTNAEIPIDGGFDTEDVEPVIIPPSFMTISYG